MPDKPTPSLYCLIPSRGRADRIIHDCKGADFRHTEIGTLFLDRRTDADCELPGLTSAARQSAGPIRGALAWVAGVGQLVVPGIGAFIAAGPIIAAMHQVRDQTPGVAIARGLMLLGLPAETAAHYERLIKNRGAILLSVHAASRDRLLRARAIFVEAGAEEICEPHAPALSADLAPGPAAPVMPAA